MGLTAPVDNRRLMLRVNYNLKASYLRRENLPGAIHDAAIAEVVATTSSCPACSTSRQVWLPM